MSPRSSIPARLPLACRCGRVRGDALDTTPTTGTRLFCYCDDCQAFADFLVQEGGAATMDPDGGTDMFHMSPARVRISEGSEELRCVRLSDQGLFRWYTGCCKTPVGNMVGGKLPFVAIVHSFMDHARDGRSREDALGKPRAYIFPECALGALPPEARPRSQFRILLRSAGMMFGWWREAKPGTSPFFDGVSKGPRVEPRVLTRDEREGLKGRKLERAEAKAKRDY